MSESTSTDRDTIEQLADSFVVRFRAGQRPSVEEYAERYPELADELRELLPALVLLEQNASPEDTAAFGSGRRHPAMPTEIGDFSIVREIGRGGMGVVYEAIQQSLGRHVALKVLSSPGLLNSTHLERFQLEARAAARLHHTHIVPVFGVGEHEGLRFYAMQFIHGQSLDLVIGELRRFRRTLEGEKQPTGDGGDPLTHAVADGLLTGHFRAAADGGLEAVQDVATGGPVAAETEPPVAMPVSHTEFTSSQSGWAFYCSVARVGLQVAEALSYAHSEGILHRDIKPSNLLLDAKGNVWVTDFGLARDESTDGLTQTGDLVGTLRYMAPERLEGWSDRRSDLYSLGATLYELLTLKPFLETPSRGQLVDKILHENPPPPSQTDPAIPRDLETIVLKATAKEPAARYHTAAAMAEDLERFLADRPILARRSMPSERFVRWCRRNPVVATLAGAVAASLVLGTVISMGQAIRATHAEHVAEARLEAEQEARRQAMAEAAKATAISNLLLESLQSADPMEAKGIDYTVRQLLDDISANLADGLQDQPDVEADIRGTIGRAYRWLDATDRAETHLELALDLRRRLFGPDHEKVAEILVDSAWNYFDQRLLLEAESRLREAVRIYRAGDTAPAPMIRALWALEECLFRMDRLEDSDAVGEEALALARASGVEIPEVANILHTLAASQARRLNYEEAERRARESVEIHRRLHGDHHPQTAWGLRQLANALASQERYDEAEVALRETLAIFRDNYSDHYSVRIATSELREILEAKGDQPALEALAREELEAAAAITRDAATKVSRLGDRLKDQQQYAEAEQVYRHALALFTAISAERLTSVLVRQGKLAELKELYLQAFADASKDSDDINRDWLVLVAQRKLIGALRALGDDPAMEALRPEITARAKRILELRTGDVAALVLVVSALGSIGDVDSVSEICSQLMSQAATSGSVTADDLNNAAWALAGYPVADPTIADCAVRMAEKASSMKPNNWGIENTLGAAYCRAGKWEAAIKTLRNGRELAGLYAPEKDGYFLAMAYAKLGQHDKAVRWIDACDRWISAHGGDDDAHCFRAEALEAIGTTFRPITHVEPPTGEEQIEILQLFAAADPEASWPRSELGESFASQSKWSEAAAHFAFVTEHAPDSVNGHYFFLALVQLKLGDEEGYHATCSTLANNAEAINEDWICDRLSWICSLAPNALENFSVPLKHLEEVVARHPKNAGYLGTLGAVLYRAGRYEEAAKRLEESIAAFAEDTASTSTVVYSQLFLAMTRWQQGDKAEARRLLAEALPAIEEALESPSTVWNRRATLELLRREAEAEALIQPEDA